MSFKIAILLIFLMIVTPLQGCSLIGKTKGSPQIFHGELRRSDTNAPVENVWVVLIQEANRIFTLVLKPDLIIDKDITDVNGRFELRTENFVPPGKLYIVALGTKKYIESSKNNFTYVGGCISLKNPQEERENLIIVPSDFVPTKNELRPSQGNQSRGVEDEEIREQIVAVISKRVK